MLETEEVVSIMKIEEISEVLETEEVVSIWEDRGDI